MNDGSINPSLLALQQLNPLDLSGNCFGGIRIPQFLGSFPELRYLNLSRSGFGGIVPHQLGNLSTLRYLDLSGRDDWVQAPTPVSYSTDATELQDTKLHVDTCQWLSQLTSLQHLDMSGVSFEKVSNWVQPLISKLPSLLELRLSSCGGLYSLPLSLPHELNFTSLSVLDLSFNFINSRIPGWLFNLSRLQYLDLSENSLYGPVPDSLGRLSLLQVLYLDNNRLNGTLPNSLGNLTDLNFLHLHSNSFHGSVPSTFGDLKNLFFLSLSHNSLYGPAPDSLGRLSLLQELYLDDNRLNGTLPNSLGNLTSLKFLHLYSNWFHGSVPSSFGGLSSLQHLSLSENNLNGTLPDSLGDLTNLLVLDLSYNSLYGPVPYSLGRLSSLIELSLNHNTLDGTIPYILGDLKSLHYLHLSSNSFHGSVPRSLGRLSSLQNLEIFGNNLNGTVPESLGHLSELQILDLSNNSLKGVLSDAHLTNLTSLDYLDISFNSQLVISVRSNWVPPFQHLRYIDMSHCQVGPRFPTWLTQLGSLDTIQFANAQISDHIPHWTLWKYSALDHLDLSGNRLNGKVPHLPSGVAYVDLSNNLLSGSIPPSIDMTMPDPVLLSLSMNNINGSIPMSIWRMKNLIFLDLSRNHLSGKLTGFTGTQLLSLHLSNNNLSGEFPSGLKGSKGLVTLDLGHNKFTGSIPTWVGESLPFLKSLRLRSNMFSGRIPSQLSLLERLQILDISQNNLIGSIPQNFGNFSAMKVAQNSVDYFFVNFSLGSDYKDYMMLVTKGREFAYGSLLSLVTILDLSNNSLSGQIPEEVANLFGLQTLNLSGNHLTGGIPEKIGRLLKVETLDLSRNMLSGPIPSSLSTLYSLSHLDLSYNNLSGRIPMGNQLQTLNDPSIYIGNRELCGPPLIKKCQGDGASSPAGGEGYEHHDNGGDEMVWFFSGMAPGFGVGVCAICGVLVLRTTWRVAFFRFADDMYDWLYVATAVNMARLRRKLMKRRT